MFQLFRFRHYATYVDMSSEYSFLCMTQMDSGLGLGMLQTCGVSIPGAKLEWDLGQHSVLLKIPLCVLSKIRPLMLPARSAHMLWSLCPNSSSLVSSVHEPVFQTAVVLSKFFLINSSRLLMFFVVKSGVRLGVRP